MIRMEMRDSEKNSELRKRTIADFGDQWTRYTDNEGFYGSVDLLSDTLGPLLPLSAFEGKCVAEIGSGTGRIVRMLLAAGAGKVLAIERSQVVVLGIAVSPTVSTARLVCFHLRHAGFQVIGVAQRAHD